MVRKIIAAICGVAVCYIEGSFPLGRYGLRPIDGPFSSDLGKAKPVEGSFLLDLDLDKAVPVGGSFSLDWDKVTMSKVFGCMRNIASRSDPTGNKKYLALEQTAREFLQIVEISFSKY
ncbi:MAG: hypothetical protein LBB21_00005 [Holosporaceae bacterium]|jgi:hypothetical protein|nr:hypothetical protein [Holosporaceae bacterium]